MEIANGLRKRLKHGTVDGGIANVLRKRLVKDGTVDCGADYKRALVTK